MVLVGAAILPHGTMIFDGDPNSESPACRERNSTMPAELIKGCTKMYTSCERAADLLAKMNLDIVLLVTPHGISLSSSGFGVYMADAARGNALWNDNWEDIKLSIPLEAQLSDQLLDFVQKRGIKADGIITFSKREAPLRWAEVAPLWFVNRKVDSHKVKYMVVSSPDKSAGFDEEMGKALHDFATASQQRFAVVISGNLAHTHKNPFNIPLYFPEPRSTLKPGDIAEEFDRMWEMWARGMPYSEDMTKELGDLVEVHPWVASQCLPWLQRIHKDNPIARSCGIRTIPILHSVLEKAIEERASVTSHFLGRYAPTYYGVMNVVFNINLVK